MNAHNRIRSDQLATPTGGQTATDVSGASRDLGAREAGRPDSGAPSPSFATNGAAVLASDVALHEAHEHARMILESITDAFVSLDLEWRYTYVNRSAGKMLDKDPSAMLGRTVWEVFPPSVGSEFDRQFRYSMEHQEKIRFEAPYPPLNCWFDCHLYPTPTLLSVFFTDTTERKRAEIALRESEARERARVAELEAVMEAVPAIVWISHDRESRRITGNRAANELLRLPAGTNASISAPADERPTHFRMLRDGVELPPEELPVQRAASTGHAARSVEVEIEFTNNERSRILGNAVPLLDSDGRPRGSVAAFSDITELRAAERDLRELNESLELRVAERTAEAKAQTERLRALATELGNVEQRERRRLAKILHDHVQQLLVGAKFRVDVLRRRPCDEKLVVQIVDDVQDLVDQTIRAVRSLTVELSPPILFEAGLPAAVEWLTAHVQRETGLGIEARIEEGIPVPDHGAQVLLFEATRELLMNVVKHSGESVARLRLCAHDPTHVELTVEDFGKGFDLTAPDLQRRATGFGLSAIRDRARLFGGSMEVRTSTGDGVRVTVVVPAGAALCDASNRREGTEQVSGGGDLPVRRPAPREARAEATRSDRATGVRVLVADDHALVRQGIVGLLDQEPDIVVVAQASNGHDAILRAREHHPDVVVMDIDMPILGGLEATRRLKRELPDVAVIGLSIYDESEIGATIIAAGAASYVTKASAATDLCREIRSAARRGD